MRDVYCLCEGRAWIISRRVNAEMVGGEASELSESLRDYSSPLPMCACPVAMFREDRYGLIKARLRPIRHRRGKTTGYSILWVIFL